MKPAPKRPPAPISVSIKDVPAHIVELVRARAQQNHRSLQGELMAILEAAVAPTVLTLDELRERNRLRGLATEDSTRALREEREAR